jgi:RNA polymerase sigma-70 factor (ECF subfamily)
VQPEALGCRVWDVTTIVMPIEIPDESAAPTLIERVRLGDRAAREAFVRAHIDEVHRAVARILVGREDAWDDVSQDAMLAILRGVARFDPDGRASVRTWLLTITARTAIDALRRRSRYAARIGALSELPAERSATPETLSEQRELAARVQEAMRRLPDEQRVALVLRAYHDMDYADIARATDSTVANVKSRIHRARAALARVLEAGEVDDG